LHGHELNSVSAGGNTLDPSSTNTLSANPPATFTLTFTNTGQNTETNVTCKVSVSGTNVSGQAAVPQTQAGQQYTCQVPLSSAPAAGNYTVTATVQPVAGEKNVANNTMSFPVTFH
jgi:archaellum component FlaF (FlaF/FlaG flagellin family)